MSLCYTTQHQPYNEPGPGFLGTGHSSFRPSGPTRHDMVLEGITVERLVDRRALLASLDRFRRGWDTSGKMRGMDVFTERAMGILTSSDLFHALDLSQEDPKAIDRYGQGDPARPISFQEVFATLYYNLGINLQSQRLFDFRGRPQYIVDPEVKPIPELI